MQSITRARIWRWLPRASVVALLLVLTGFAARSKAQQGKPGADAKNGPVASSYDQVSPALLGQVSFEEMRAADKAGKGAVTARQRRLLEERYDLAVRVSDRVKMSRGKPIPVGPATRLTAGTTWDSLAGLAPEEVRDRALFPKGFLPLPHPHHEVGGHGLSANGAQAAAAS